MESRINKKIGNYMTKFKDDIRDKAFELGITNNDNITQLLQYMYDYDRLCVGKEDFMKRKRCKIGININERCIAKRSCGEQCTRRKKKGYNFCGTHTKGIPHGVCEVSDDNSQTNISKIEVRMQEICGIMYFIDSKNNVYNVEDVMMEKTNPKIIGQYIANELEPRIEYF
jgi:hypothetical protein